METICQALLIRDTFTNDTTLGRLFINGIFTSYTLEDEYRGTNVKISKYTAIPEGTYKVKVTRSPKYGRDMPLVLDVPNFTGIRFHGGNDHEDTEGCILVAENRSGDRIWGTMERVVTVEFQKYEEIYLTIINRQGLKWQK